MVDLSVNLLQQVITKLLKTLCMHVQLFKGEREEVLKT